MKWSNVLNFRYPITSLYEFFKSDGTSEILSISNGKLNKGLDGLITPVAGAIGEKANFLSYKNRTLKDVVLIADGGKLKYYDGSVKEVTPHVPTDGTNGTPAENADPGQNDLVYLSNFRCMTMKKDRLYAAAHPEVKNRVSFCYFDTYLGYAVYDYWPSTYFIDVPVDDNDQITALKPFRDALIIFCKRSVWALLGEGPTMADYQLIKINVQKGCISPDSVQVVGNNLFYLGEDAVYSLFSTDKAYVSAKEVSTNIGPILKGIGTADKSKAVAAYFDNRYYLSFPSGLTIVFDSTLECWMTFTNIQANSFLEHNGELYFSTNRGYIQRFDDNVFSDDGRIIPFVMKTKLVDFKLPINTKKIRRMWVLAKQHQGYTSTMSLDAIVDQFQRVSLSSEASTDLGAEWDNAIWDEAEWDSGELSQMEMKMKQKVKSLQMEITNDRADEPLTIYGMVFEYKVKKP